MAANSAMVLLYWEIGRTILERQDREGWGARVIDRLSTDLREAFPNMHGLSPRNLKYMRAFAAAWSDRTIVQRVVAQIPWRQNITLMERLDDSATRLWYAEQASRLGWSQPILSLQIEGHAHERQGKALTNFPATLPPADSDMAAQVFKDPYPFDFLGTADPRREREVEQAVVDHIQLWQKPSAKLALEQKSQTPSGKLPSALIGQTPSGSEVSHNNLINLGFCCER